MAFDHHGNFYVGYGGLPGTIDVYAPGGTKPFRTITDSQFVYPVAFAFDSADNLYVANGCACYGSVFEYGPKSNTPIRIITRGVQVPLQIAVDRAGYLYVLNYQGTGSLMVYAPGQTKVARSLAVSEPRTMKFNALGNLFVLNWNVDAQPAYVGVYSGGKGRARKIELGRSFPTDLAFDRANDLYVLNYLVPTWGVQVFQPGGNLVRTITAEVVSPGGIAIDPVDQNLYVSSDGREYGEYGWISVYAHDSVKALYTITSGLNTPSQLLFSSQ